MHVIDPVGVEWEVSREWFSAPRWAGGHVVRVLVGGPWLVRACSERGELEWRVRGALASRRAIEEVAAALRRGDRKVVPTGAERVLPDSPLWTGGG